MPAGLGRAIVPPSADQQAVGVGRLESDQFLAALRK